MKKVPFLFFMSMCLALAGPGISFAQVPSIPEVQGEASKEAPPPARKKKSRRKPLRTGSYSADDPVVKEPAAPAPAKAQRPVDPRRVNSLLFGTMEKLETLGALYETLRLQVSAETLDKISEMEKAAGRVAADYFKAEAPSPDREELKTYRGLLDSALQSVKALKDVKDRVKAGEGETAILLCRDLNAAIDEELAGAKLSVPSAAAEAPRQEAEPAASAGTSGNETAALAALSEVRKALEAYKAKEGKYPKSLTKLAPKYISRIPEISAADHPATREVLEINSSDYDDTPFQAITDTGKWLYFTDKKSKLYGRLLIDCSHKGAGGAELYQAGE